MTEFLTELSLVAEKIGQAKYPEQIFGELTSTKDPLKQGLKIYRQLSKLTHPDLHSDPVAKTLAQSAFVRLTQLWESTQESLRNGTYGDVTIDSKGGEVSVSNGAREYLISTKFYETRLFSYYPCTYLEDSNKFKAVFKINPDPANNDRLTHEAEVLKILSETRGYEKFHKYFPKLVDSFRFIDVEDTAPRQVNILSAEPGVYSLAEVREVYPDGIDPKDLAWIFRRLLVGLGFAHNNQVLHGALLPQNIFIHPEKHGLVITEWSNCIVDFTDKAKFIPGLDINMGAKCMVDLSGNLPRRLRLFFDGCTASNPKNCPQDAWGLLEEFDELIEDLWGPKKFHPFSMPKRVSLNAFW